jgi:hypothetical protein
MTSTKLIVAALMVPVLILIALVVAAAAVVHYLSTRHAATTNRVQTLETTRELIGVINSIVRVSRRGPRVSRR